MKRLIRRVGLIYVAAIIVLRATNVSALLTQFVLVKR